MNVLMNTMEYKTYLHKEGFFFTAGYYIKKSILIYSLLLSSNFLMMPTSAEMRKSYRRCRHFHLPSTPGRNHSHTISFSYSHFRFSRPDRSRPGSGIMSVQTGTLPSNPLCPTAETVTNTRVT